MQCLPLCYLPTGFPIAVSCVDTRKNNPMFSRRTPPSNTNIALSVSPTDINVNIVSPGGLPRNINENATGTDSCSSRASPVRQNKTARTSSLCDKDEDSHVLTKRKRWGSAWCSAVNCRNNRKQKPDLSFFKFPLDPVRSKKWVVASGRADLVDKDPRYLYKNCKICGEHFESLMFLNDLKNRLHDHAVPTKFNDSDFVLAPSLMEMSRKKADMKTKKNPDGRFTVQQELSQGTEKVWIKSEIIKAVTEVKLEEEACSNFPYGNNQVVGNSIFIKEEILDDENESPCPEDFVSLEMNLKEEINTDEIFEYI